jgi:hypothetical protein
VWFNWALGLQAAKFIPHLRVCRDPGGDEVDGTRGFDFEEEDGFFVQCGDISDDEVNERNIGCLKSFRKGIMYVP